MSGFGVAAWADDGAAVAARADLVSEWAAVLRSRRLLVADADPDCVGARAAIEAAVRAAVVGLGQSDTAVVGSGRSDTAVVGPGQSGVACDGPVYLLGQPVASVSELARLAEAGVTIAADLDEVPESAVVVFPAHGVPLPVRAEVAARGLRVVDATCPLAADVHEDIRTYANRGDTVVLLTGAQHGAAVPVSVSQAPESVLPVRELADMPDPRKSWIAPDRLSVVVQTGMPVEEATAMLSVLRARFPLLRGQHYDALCYAASDRAAAVKQVAASSDLVLVLGDAEDPDAMHMGAEAAAACSVVHTVAAVGDIEAGWLTGVDTVGVILSRSARPGLVTQVSEALSGLGPLTVVNRQVRTSPGQTQTWLPAPEPEPASV